MAELVAAGGAGDGVDALAVDRQRQDGALALQTDPLRRALEAVGHARQDARLDNLNPKKISIFRSHIKILSLVQGDPSGCAAWFDGPRFCLFNRVVGSF